MRSNLAEFTSVFLFNVLALSLAIALVFYRTEIAYAHGNGGATDLAAVNPRDMQVENDNPDDDDEDDPPMDGDDTEDSQSYTVQPGDNLWKIAEKLGVPFATLKSQHSDPSLIQPGDQITIVNESPVDDSPPPATDGTPDNSEGSDGGQTFQFVVRRGDTLSQIAEYLGVPLASLAAQTDDPSSIYPGQVFLYVSKYRIATPPLFTDLDGTDSDGHDTTGLEFEDVTDYDGYDTPLPPADYKGPYRPGYKDRLPDLPDLEYGYLTPEPPTDHDGIWTPPDLEYGYTTQPPPTDNDGIDTLPDLEYGYDSYRTPASQDDFGRYS